MPSLRAGLAQLTLIPPNHSPKASGALSGIMSGEVGFGECLDTNPHVMTDMSRSDFNYFIPSTLQGCSTHGPLPPLQLSRCRKTQEQFSCPVTWGRGRLHLPHPPPTPQSAPRLTCTSFFTMRSQENMTSVYKCSFLRAPPPRIFLPSPGGDE